MSLVVSELKRVFKHRDIELQDVENLSINEIGKHYSGTYPELLNSTPTFVEIKNNVEYYKFETSVGLKG